MTVRAGALLDALCVCRGDPAGAAVVVAISRGPQYGRCADYPELVGVS